MEDTLSKSNRVAYCVKTLDAKIGAATFPHFLAVTSFKGHSRVIQGAINRLVAHPAWGPKEYTNLISIRSILFSTERVQYSTVQYSTIQYSILEGVVGSTHSNYLADTFNMPISYQ